MKSGASWWKTPRWCGVAVIVGAVLVGCGGPDPASEPTDDGGTDSSPEPAEEPREGVDEKAAEDAPDPEDAGPDDSGDVSWNTAATEYRGEHGETYTYDCPGGADLDSDGGLVWGDDPYTDDSAVCVAAVHAGLITPADGGSVIIEILPGEESYDSSEQNGVETSDWGSWNGSFTFTDQSGQVSD